MTTAQDDITLREATGAALAPPSPDASLLQPIIRWAKEAPNRPLVSYRRGDQFIDVSAADFYARVRALAKGLIASGVEPNDRVVLMSRTRLEWLVIDYAIIAAGGVTVPVFETSSSEQLEWILSDSGAVLAFVETPAMRASYEEVHTHATSCRDAFVIDEGGIDEMIDRGRDIAEAVVDERIAAITADRIATIVYTSGTTGRPKGCIQTHGNLCTNVEQNLGAVRSMLTDDETTLVFLPLAHTLTKAIALVCMEWGVKLAFATGLTQMPEELPLVRPTLVVAVPRVFEKVYDGAQHKAAAEGHAKIFHKAEQVAIRWSERRANGHIGLWTQAQHAVFDRLVYRKLQAVFGGRLRFAFSGGGPLGERLTHFFDGVGVKIFEGYGLTETSPTLTVNSAEAWKPGTVGRPLAGTTIRIAEDGEILAKGPQVFRGYWNADAATADVFDEDGWFRTGDIGHLDADRFLKITGRKKELIVTAGGKNVAPAPLEDHLRANPLISQAVVVGDGRPFVAAMLAIDEEALESWAADHGRAGTPTAELLSDEQLRVELQAAVDVANASVSKAESIRKFAILPRDLTIAAGELTPTLKVRRAVVAKTYESVIEDLYG
ncbi:MAG TPA: long-chain fatty acid--CoA ligase [Acidimicrobiales bacterium]|nr:long-chain fatty acid--CoA ligase [Acidimicrobiales bacterium]